MEEKNLKAVIEAVLFSFGEPVNIKLLAAAADVSEFELQVVLSQLEEDYDKEERGIRIIRLEDSYQLVTKKEYYENLIRVAVRPEKPKLTAVLMETLSIIAVRQPVTKSDIEKIRGVSSDHAVNRLVEYGLVKEDGRLDAPGRPILFATTDEFLRRFGFESKSMLPVDDYDPEVDTEAETEEENVNVEI